MFRLIKNEWQKISVSVICTTAFLSIMMSILSCTLYKNYSLFCDLEAWEVGTELIGFLFPLFVVIPVCWNMYYERKNNFLLYTLPRISKGKYLIVKWLTYTISAFLILFVPYLLSAVFAIYIKPAITPWTQNFNHIFAEMFTKAPIVYALILSLWRGLIGVLVMSFGFALSLYVDNIFIILTGPFIYSILENFVLSILGMPEYRLVTAFDPTILSLKTISPSFAVGPILVCAMILLILLYFSKKKDTSIYKV